jgi:hypothetical protein
LKDIDPGVDADEERGPEWQHHQHEHHGLPAPRGTRHAVSDRETNQQQQQRRPGGDLQALEIGGEVEPIGAEQGVVLERQCGESLREALPTGAKIEHGRVGRLGDRRMREADLEHDQERKEEERDEPEIRNEHDQPLAPGAMPAALAHCSVHGSALS